MSVHGILNADMSTIGRWFRTSFDWWLEQLAGLVPASLRKGGSNGAALIAVPNKEGSPAYRLFKRGQELPYPAAAKGKRIALALPPGDVLVREVDVPALSAGDIRRLLAFDLDRLTPFRPQDVYFDIILPANGTGERVRAQLGVVPRARAHALIEQARSAGLEATAMGRWRTTGGGMDFDFLRQMRMESTDVRRPRSSAVWWMAVGVLLLLNLGVAVVRDMASVSDLRRKLEEQSPEVATTTAFATRVKREQARRENLVQRRSSSDPLRVLGAVSRTLPEGAWVQRLEWNGKTVRLKGFKKDGVDVVAALRSSPFLANVRDSSSDTPAQTATGQPFDVAADTRKIAR